MLVRKPTFTGQYIRWNSFSPKLRKISLIKTLVHRALMICSKTKLGSELDKIKQLLIENGYPTDVLLSCINQKLANFAVEKTFGPEKCPVYLKLPWIGNVSSKFENHFHEAILYLNCLLCSLHLLSRDFCQHTFVDSQPTALDPTLPFIITLDCSFSYWLKLVQEGAHHALTSAQFL